MSPEHTDSTSAADRSSPVDPRYWTVFDDTRPALQRLGDNGWRNVILGNHVPGLDGLVERLGLVDLVDLVLSSARLARCAGTGRAVARVLDSGAD